MQIKVMRKRRQSARALLCHLCLILALDSGAGSRSARARVGGVASVAGCGLKADTGVSRSGRARARCSGRSSDRRRGRRCSCIAFCNHTFHSHTQRTQPCWPSLSSLRLVRLVSSLSSHVRCCVPHLRQREQQFPPPSCASLARPASWQRR